MSRRKLQRRRADKRSGILLAVVGVALISALAIGVFSVGQLQGKFEPQTNCPLSGPTAIHVVLIDQSDPISAQQAQRIRQWAYLLKKSAKAGERFDLYTIEGNTQSQLDPVRSVCATPQDANPFYQNEQKVHKQYAEFVAALDKTIEDLLQMRTKPNSPIIESLRAAAQTSFGLISNRGIPLKITLISDLVQHSSVASHFRARPDFELLSQNANWAQLRADLKGADVEVLYVLRPTALRNFIPIQNRGHQQFWSDLIGAAGGRIAEFTPF